MLTHHTLECAKSSLNPESHWLVNGSFLLTESFCKKYVFSATSSWCILVNPFAVMHPTRILVHPRVHRAHRLKGAGLVTIVIASTVTFSAVPRFPKWVPRNPRVPQTNLKGSTSYTFQF